MSQRNLYGRFLLSFSGRLRLASILSPEHLLGVAGVVAKWDLLVRDFQGSLGEEEAVMLQDWQLFRSFLPSQGIVEA